MRLACGDDMRRAIAVRSLYPPRDMQPLYGVCAICALACGGDMRLARDMRRAIAVRLLYPPRDMQPPYGVCAICALEVR